MRKSKTEVGYPWSPQLHDEVVVTGCVGTVIGVDGATVGVRFRDGTRAWVPVHDVVVAS